MELADRTEESADDMTAADTAPRPMKETAVGVRYCRTRGSVRRGSSIIALPLPVPFFKNLTDKPVDSQSK